MKLDIVFVSYNSSKWIENNINSILKSNYDLKRINLIFYDNNSSDDTVNILKKNKEKYEKKFNNFIVIEGNKNLGFGRSNNKASRYGTSDYIFFLNIDTEIEKETLKKLEFEINNSDSSVAIWELRQKPYEHPKYYDPITGYTTWSSGACFVIKREVFEKVHGFDKNLFMYCEDVELSWHVRQLKYNIKYLYNVPITHYSYKEPNAFKVNQYIYSRINNLYIRCKYGSLKNVGRGHIFCIKAILKNQTYGMLTDEEYIPVKRIIKREYFKMMLPRLGARLYKHSQRFSYRIIPKFPLLDYEVAKLEPFYVIPEYSNKMPLVSIIVRTCGRPDTLRETLISLRNQVYKNIEIVIVEDGKNISEDMINKEFNDLNIKYYSTGKNVGRSKVGNIGMKIASGKYLNFLDDDDAFYPEHIQVLASEMEKNKYDILYDTAFETSIDVSSKTPYKYSVMQISIPFHGHFSKLKLAKGNITPIQSVMFSKKVFNECGGFDENIDALEDWDLWLTFSQKYRFNHIENTTSVYRVPFNRKEAFDRQKFLNSSFEYIYNKHKNDILNLTIFDIFWDNYER